MPETVIKQSGSVVDVLGSFGAGFMSGAMDADKVNLQSDQFDKSLNEQQRQWNGEQEFAYRQLKEQQRQFNLNADQEAQIAIMEDRRLREMAIYGTTAEWNNLQSQLANNAYQQDQDRGVQRYNIKTTSDTQDKDRSSRAVQHADEMEATRRGLELEQQKIHDRGRQLENITVALGGIEWSQLPAGKGGGWLGLSPEQQNVINQAVRQEYGNSIFDDSARSGELQAARDKYYRLAQNLSGEKSAYNRDIASMAIAASQGRVTGRGPQASYGNVTLLPKPADATKLADWEDEINTTGSAPIDTSSIPPEDYDELSAIEAMLSDAIDEMNATGYGNGGGRVVYAKYKARMEEASKTASSGKGIAQVYISKLYNVTAKADEMGGTGIPMAGG